MQENTERDKKTEKSIVWRHILEQQLSDRIRLLNKQEKKVNHIYSEIISSAGISGSAFWILYALSDSAQEYTQQRFSEEWSFPKQTVKSAIKSLVEKGYISLSCISNQRKEKSIRLTSDGNLFMQKCVKPVLEAEQMAFSKMTVHEQLLYVELAQKYIGYLRETTEAICSDRQSISISKSNTTK